MFVMCQVLLAMFAVTATTALAATSAGEQDVERRIKAAFIYHFCNYIDWPESAFESEESPLLLGVMGSTAMADALGKAVARRTAHGRPLQVRRLDVGDSLRGLHLLYVDDAVPASVRDQLASVDDSVLLVTDTPDGLGAGSAVNFVVEDDRVRFDVGLDAIKRGNLSVSAQLLTVARNVRKEAE